MKLRNRNKFGFYCMEWRRRDQGGGVRLVVTGPAFARGGFSLGVYSAEALSKIADSFDQQKPKPRQICEGLYDERDLRYDPLYTFTKPTKFANAQGHDTRLAIHAEAARETKYWWQRELYGPRTATIHEQGERCFWRWLGRYPITDLCAFLRAATDAKEVSSVKVSDSGHDDRDANDALG